MNTLKVSAAAYRQQNAMLFREKLEDEAILLTGLEQLQSYQIECDPKLGSSMSVQVTESTASSVNAGTAVWQDWPAGDVVFKTMCRHFGTFTGIKVSGSGSVEIQASSQSTDRSGWFGEVLGTDSNPVTGRNVIFAGQDRYILSSDDGQSVIGDLSNSLLGSVPLPVTTDTGIAVTLGPTSQANSASEYAALKAGKIETVFISGSNLANTDKLFTYGTAWLENMYAQQAFLHSSPHPTTGTNDWWNRGGVRFYADGEGTIAIAYALNANNRAAILIDGQRVSTADTSGVVSNAVGSSAGALQWVKIDLTGDKRRLITLSTGSIYSLVRSPGVTISRPDYVGKAICFGDSFAGRYAGSGETPLIRTTLSHAALELLGYDAIDASTGGTGWLNANGGAANGKGSHLDYIRYYRDIGRPLGVALNSYSLIWLFGTGNVNSPVETADDYLGVITEALNVFSEATVAVSSCYEGFNTPSSAAAINARLYAAVVAAQSAFPKRVKWVPIDSAYKFDGTGVFSGTGSVPAPAGDGNADVYFSNATQGAGDRHPNNKGVVHAARFYARELIRAGVPFAR